MKNIKLIKELNKLKRAVLNVDSEWGYNDDMADTNTKSEYPFRVSFDEFALQLEEWVDAVNYHAKKFLGVSSVVDVEDKEQSKEGMVEALKEMKKAYLKVDKLWEGGDTILDDEDILSMYPHTKSFDEVVIEVEEWVEEMVDQLKEIESERK